MRFVVFAVVSLLGACGTPQPLQPLLTKDAIEKARTLVQQSQAAGYIAQWSCTGNTAYVRPEFWTAMDVDGKRGLAISLAGLCEAEDSGRSITIFNQQTGKRLAAFSLDRFTVE